MDIEWNVPIACELVLLEKIDVGKLRLLLSIFNDAQMRIFRQYALFPPVRPSEGWPLEYLQLCADDNIQVCNPSTPAQYFHLLRRQIHRAFRKPLIILAPKSLLRHKMAVSPVKDLTGGSFVEVLEDTPDDRKAAHPENTVLFCSGKIYYDLIQRRENIGRSDTAILRMEQLYPFPGTKNNKV